MLSVTQEHERQQQKVGKHTTTTTTEERKKKLLLRIKTRHDETDQAIEEEKTQY